PAHTPRPAGARGSGGGSGGVDPSPDEGDDPTQPSAPRIVDAPADPTPQVIYMAPSAEPRRRDAGSVRDGSGADGSASDATPGPSATTVPARGAQRGDSIHISGDGFAPAVKLVIELHSAPIQLGSTMSQQKRKSSTAATIPD